MRCVTKRFEAQESDVGGFAHLILFDFPTQVCRVSRAHGHTLKSELSHGVSSMQRVPKSLSDFQRSPSVPEVSIKMPVQLWTSETAQVSHL